MFLVISKKKKIRTKTEKNKQERSCV